MTAPEVATLIAATGAAVASIINAIAGLHGRAAMRERTNNLENTLKERSTAVETALNSRSNKVDEKLGEIHALADGNLTAVRTALAVANEKIAGLEKTMTSFARRATDTTDVPQPPLKVEVVNTPLETHAVKKP